MCGGLLSVVVVVVRFNQFSKKKINNLAEAEELTNNSNRGPTIQNKAEKYILHTKNQQKQTEQKYSENMYFFDSPTTPIANTNCFVYTNTRHQQSRWVNNDHQQNSALSTYTLYWMIGGEKKLMVVYLVKTVVFCVVVLLLGLYAGLSVCVCVRDKLRFRRFSLILCCSIQQSNYCSRVASNRWQKNNRNRQI